MAGEDIARRLLKFAALVGRLVEMLPNTRLGRHVAGQFVRCGTAPAFHYAEARNAESRRDFIHKLHLCLKELNESGVCLDLSAESDLLPGEETDPAIAECDALCRIIGKSIVTAKSNAR